MIEGKCALIKTFGGLDSIPIVLDTKDPDEIVETLVRLRPSYGAVNLEDISAPRCFEIERRVIDALDCPVMHDDQHGTAIVVSAALLGATKVLDSDLASLRVVISGVGAAGAACVNILLAAGISDITVVDTRSILHLVLRRRADEREGRAGRAHQPGRSRRWHGGGGAGHHLLQLRHVGGWRAHPAQTSERTLFMSMSVRYSRAGPKLCAVLPLLPERSHGRGTRCTRKG